MTHPPAWIKRMEYSRHSPRTGLGILPWAFLLAGLVLAWSTWALRDFLAFAR